MLVHLAHHTAIGIAFDRIFILISVQRDVTDKQGTTYDLFNVHAFSETWLKKNLLFSTGYSFANLNEGFSGSRVYGDDFDVAYSPDPLNGLGYTSLNGGAHKQEHVMNVNLMTIPLKNLTIVPSLRVQQDSWDANSSGTGTLGDDTGPFTSNSNGDSLDVRERLDVRYAGVAEREQGGVRDRGLVADADTPIAIGQRKVAFG